MSPPIYTPDGSEVSEIVLPDGSTASEVIDPDGNVVFEAAPDIPDSGVSRWTFDDGDTESGTAIDNWGNNDAAINGATTGVTGSNQTYTTNEAYSFDGSDDYVDTTLALSQPAATVGCWIKTTGDGRILSSIDTTLEAGQIEISIDGNGYPRFIIYNGSSNDEINPSITVADGRWHHLALAYSDNDEIVGYVDGSRVGSTTTASFTPSNSQSIWNMRYPRTDINFLSGECDDIRVYSKKLSDTDVSNWYSNGAI